MSSTELCVGSNGSGHHFVMESHTSLAYEHSKKIWLSSSAALLHNVQVISECGVNLFRRTFVGSRCCTKTQEMKAWRGMFAFAQIILPQGTLLPPVSQ